LLQKSRATLFRARAHRYNAEGGSSLWDAKFRRRLGYDQQHAEHVRELSILLFDQLQAVHHLPRNRACCWEARIADDTGHMVGIRAITSTGISGAQWRYSGLEGRNRAIVRRSCVS